MSHLKKEQYVTAPERSTYQITNQGRAFIDSINRKPHRYNHVWDGVWHVVLLEIPESARKTRERFRANLLQLGFGPLYKSVYISPWDYTSDVDRFIRHHNLSEHVTVFVGEMVHTAITPQTAHDIWHLAELSARYDLIAKRLQQDFRPRVETSIKGSDSLDIFIQYLELGEVISDLSLSDPMLPIELLPTSWIGRTVMADLTAEFIRLAHSCPKDSPYQKFML